MRYLAWILDGPLFGLALAACLALLGVECAGELEVRAALAEVEATGGFVRWSGSAVPRDVELRAWLDELALGEAPTWLTDEEFDALAPCAGRDLATSKGYFDAEEWMHRELYRPNDGLSVDPCALAALAEIARRDEPLASRAREAARLPLASPEWLYREPIDVGRSSEAYSTRGLLVWSKLLRDDAFWRAQRGETAELERDLRALWVVVAHGRRIPFAFSVGLGLYGTLQALDTLETVLRDAPRELDLAWIDAELARFDAHALVLDSLLVERTVLDRIIRNFPDGLGESAAGPSLERVPTWLERVLVPFERALVLRSLSNLARELRSEDWRLLHGDSYYVGPRSPTLLYGALSGMMTPANAELSVEQARRLESRIVLARLALLAHREGAKAALAAAARTLDPPSGEPVRARLENGELVLWTPGDDLIDDDGADAAFDDEEFDSDGRVLRDVVWRLRVR